MDHPLNSLAGRHSQTFRDLKKDKPGRINLLVGKHNIRETVTPHKQAAGTHRKNIEQNAHYLLSIPRSGTQRHQASNRLIEKMQSKMLTICSLFSPFAP